VGAPAEVTAPGKAKGEAGVDKGVDAAAKKLGEKPAGKELDPSDPSPGLTAGGRA